MRSPSDRQPPGRWTSKFAALSRGVAAFLASLMLVCAVVPGEVGAQPASTPREVEIADVIGRIADLLEASRARTASELTRLGFGDALGEVVKLDDRVGAISTDGVLEALYRRAEYQETDQGMRFLAKVYDGQRRKYPSLGETPGLEVFKEYPPAQLAKAIEFAPMSAFAKASEIPLPPVAERALDRLSDALSGTHLGRIRAVLFQNLRKPGFGNAQLERVIAESPSVEAVLKRVVRDYTPPPRPEQAILGITKDMAGHFPALGIEPAIRSIIDELSASLPDSLKALGERGEALPSRARQRLLAGTADMSTDVAQALSQASPRATLTGGRTVTVEPSALDAQPLGRSLSGKTGSERVGNDAGSRMRSSFEGYVQRTFQPSGGGGPEAAGLTPRDWETAVKSPKAARGIAVGGRLSWDPELRATRAFWYPNAVDPRFGRLFVVLGRDSTGAPMLGASRVLFKDSFESALSVLWENNGEVAKFRQGEILVAMSLDPGAGDRGRQELIIKRAEGLEARKRDLIAREENLRNARRVPQDAQRERRLESAFEQLERDMAEYNTQFADLKAEYNRLPRAIVVHPGLYGREMAWSASRVDFWFNRLSELQQEAIDASTPMPAALKSIDLGSVDTWQFYERDAAIQAGTASGGARPLLVHSQAVGGGNASVRSHFAVSMFSLAEKEGRRLLDVERPMQGVLDWLGENHHDFIRLNDFAESFAFGRWLATTGISLTVFQFAGPPRSIATPSAALVGEGPVLSAR